jgi:hypothetical protein
VLFSCGDDGAKWREEGCIIFFFLAPKLEKFPLGGKLWWLVGENHGGSFTFSQVGNTMWSIEKVS